MTAAPTDLRRYLIALAALTVIQIVATLGFNQAPVLAPAAAPELGISSADVAYYVALLYLAAMISTLGGGVMNRRFGPIRFSQIGLVITALGSFVLAVGGTGLAAFSALVVGLGSGPLNIASSHVLSRVSPPRLANVTFSLKQSGVPLGFAICGAALPVLAIDLGWRWAAAAVGAVSLVVALAVQPLRALYDEEHAKPQDLPLLPSLAEILEPLRLAWRDPILRPMCLIGMVFSATQAIVVNFTVVYAVEGLKISYVLAGALLSAATLTGAVGRVFWGALADLSRRPSAILSGIGAIVALASATMAFSTPAWPVSMIYAVCIVLGGTAVGWNGVFIAESAARAPAGRVAELTGATQLFVFFGALVSPLLFRAVLAITGAYETGYLLLAASVIACSLMLARAAAK
ncbi:MAG: MFS transporter [Alphaproteobacteria bacterium]|nr:MFS transporter [Alphaproteobacteria bacterium]